MKKSTSGFAVYLIAFAACFSCKDSRQGPPPLLIKEMNLKRGDLISCGAENKKFGEVNFSISASKKIKDEFNLGVKLLHSFEYDEAEKVFANIIDEDPGCAMAWWGIAMSNFHPLWAPPNGEELKKGSGAAALAISLPAKTKREAAYIAAIAAYYEGYDSVDHRTRCLRFEKSMEDMYRDYPQDRETAIFYSLALDAAADPADKTYSRQKKAGAILTGLYTTMPNHPGVVHYLIHTYDYPELAGLALPAARRYASVASSSAHALHMPSHIFTRLGLWEEAIQSNLMSINAAQCYANSAGIKGHWDEEIHGLDYLVYAYLQKGENGEARKYVDYLDSINDVSAFNFKVAYAFAAIPSRYVLENRLWKEAAALPINYQEFPWQEHPWPLALLHFTRALGWAHLDKLPQAGAELDSMQSIYDRLVKEKDNYKAMQVLIQMKEAAAWISHMEGDNQKALRLMKEATDAEELTGKHPVTPGEVLPARELLGDLLFDMGQYEQALAVYENSLKSHPNRFNGLYGAGIAAEKSNHPEKARYYYSLLGDMVKSSHSDRPEIIAAKQFLEY